MARLMTYMKTTRTLVNIVFNTEVCAIKLFTAVFNTALVYVSAFVTDSLAQKYWTRVVVVCTGIYTYFTLQ